MKRLFNITDLGDAWGMTRGGSSKHYKKGNILQPTHYHKAEVFWESMPPKPKGKKK